MLIQPRKAPLGRALGWPSPTPQRPAHRPLPSVRARRGTMMFDRTIADPQELAMMREAFERYCLSHDVVTQSDRENIALRIVLIFKGGARTVDELITGLERPQT